MIKKIIGLIFLLILVGGSVYGIVNYKTGLKIGADETLQPRKLKVTNLSENSFSVSWYTEQPTAAVIKYGPDPKNLTRTAVKDDFILNTQASLIHHLTLKSLIPDTIYYFKILSSNQEFSRDGQPWEQKTAPSITNAPLSPIPVYGKVVNTDQALLIYLDLPGGSPLSTKTNLDGSWSMAINNARSQDLLSYLKPAASDLINLLIVDGKGEETTAVITANQLEPVPDISLGQNNNLISQTDFSLQDLNEATSIDPEPSPLPSLSPAPESEINILTATLAAELTVSLPASQTFIQPRPNLSGTAPANTIITISIHSETEIAGTTVSDENGNWNFTPPDDLEPGEHTITISYLNEAGQTVTETKTFTVANPSELPVAGNANLTLLLLIAGIGLISAGAYERLR